MKMKTSVLKKFNQADSEAEQKNPEFSCPDFCKIRKGDNIKNEDTVCCN